MPMPAYAHRERGVTLIELIITIVILSIAVVAVVSAISSSIGRSADPLWQTKSLQLAQAYLDEIGTKRFDEDTGNGGVPSDTSGVCDIGAEAGETRATFDDVDDYDGVDDSPPVLQTAAGFSSYTGYRVQVAVVCAGTEVGGADNNAAKRIDVTVTPPGQSALVFSLYRGNF